MQNSLKWSKSPNVYPKFCFFACHCHHFFQHFGTIYCLPGSNQYMYLAEVNRISQVSDSGESRTNNHPIPSLTLYPLSHSALPFVYKSSSVRTAKALRIFRLVCPSSLKYAVNAKTSWTYLRNQKNYMLLRSITCTCLNFRDLYLYS